MSISYTILQVKPNIFFVEFTNSYDMNMTFLRYQEFYESPSPKFRGKVFKILDFMKWYSAKYGKGNFTYPTDWCGFNLGSKIIRDVIWLGIPDRNDYDSEMEDIYTKCCAKSPEPFYIIGCKKSDKITKDHELAHAYFYTNKQYKKEMVKLVKTLAPELRITMNSLLKKIGYTPKVYIDEIQAYMATGLLNLTGVSLEIETALIEARNPFIRVFKEYNK